ncbi:MAG: ECF-type sigma factor [Planctomycetota bacterium]|jgi:RNA polymerase sigma factor (TIGR02999 family)
MSDKSKLTRAFTAAEDGTAIPADEVMPQIYDELRRIAGAYLREQRKGHTLQPTALVHEAFLRLIDVSQIPWSDASHFRAIAARVMRQVLVDHARRTGAAKRGGDRLRVTLDTADAVATDDALDVLDLDTAMKELAELHERKAQVVELLFFGGLTHAEAARIVGVSQKTIEADWYMARAWLGSRLGDKEL